MPADPPRLIAHLDMDAFYASVELLRYPELRGQPVVIGGGRRHQPELLTDPHTGCSEYRFATLSGYVGRGVATTATYEARALGVHSAMGLMKAAALAPEAVLLPTDFDSYRKYSRLFKAAVRLVAPTIEDRGIDEIFIDLTGLRLRGGDRYLSGVEDAPVTLASHAAETPMWPPDGETVENRATDTMDAEDDAWWIARDVAKTIKAAVRAATGLRCSIAIAPNKLLAKLASDLDKPDGLTVIRPRDIAMRIWPLPPRRINGIGPKAAAILDALDIATIGALARADPALLIENFGEHYGAWLLDAAHGRDDRPVVTRSEPKSISRETTFERDLSVKHDREALGRIFRDLCDRVAGDLVRKRYAGRTIGVKLRFDNFRTVTRDVTVEAPAQDAGTIRRAAGACLKRIVLDRRIRLLGVRVGTLSAVDGGGEAADTQGTG